MTMKKNDVFKFSLVCLLCAALAACGSDDGDDVKPLTVSPASVSMHYDKEQQLTAEGATSWKSDNEYVATVDKNGLLKGRHIGTTQIVASNDASTGTCAVTIVPQYNLYDTPVLNWGASLAQVKAAETHTFVKTSNNVTTYVYNNGVINTLVMYLFENGGLASVAALEGESYFALHGLYLIERYEPLGKSDDMYIFIDALTIEQAKLSIGFSYQTISGDSYAVAIYMPYTKTKSRSASTQHTLKDFEIPVEMLDVLK